MVLLVNVASKCGFTPQYAGLEKLYEKYKDKGFVIVGVPANNFGAQEPGSNDEIKTFCSRNYNVTFPMRSKVSVKGDDKTPLYQYLTDSSAKTGGEIKWNFTKFLVDKKGNVINRFEVGSNTGIGGYDQSRRSRVGTVKDFPKHLSSLFPIELALSCV